MRKGFLKRAIERASLLFSQDYHGYWGHLSRATNLFIILNISLFFLTELVTKQSYFYTYFSLLFLGFVKVGILLPLGFHNRICYYMVFLMAELTGVYFLVASAWYWIATNKL
jgi:hypothetical protein